MTHTAAGPRGFLDKQNALSGLVRKGASATRGNCAAFVCARFMHLSIVISFSAVCATHTARECACLSSNWLASLFFLCSYSLATWALISAHFFSPKQVLRPKQIYFNSQMASSQALARGGGGGGGRLFFRRRQEVKLLCCSLAQNPSNVRFLRRFAVVY